MPRLTRRCREALSQVNICSDFTTVDGRTLLALARHGLVETRRLLLDGRHIRLKGGGTLPRRVRVARLTARGRELRDYYHVRRARRLDRQLRGQRRALTASSL